jgi:hypothetical protein
MSYDTIQIHNAETGEVIFQELTEEQQNELDAQRQAARDDKAAQIAAVAEKATARTALLERLGITEEEAGLLLS